MGGDWEPGGARPTLGWAAPCFRTKRRAPRPGRVAEEERDGERAPNLASKGKGEAADPQPHAKPFQPEFSNLNTVL